MQYKPKHNKEIWSLTTATEMEKKEYKIRKISVRRKPFWSWPGQGKVFMVVGGTGVGKSTLINGMVNYMMDVKYEDSFRYKLVDDGETRSQAHSQTKWITAYSFYENDKIPYKLTVIDTPGYGDTEGVVRDKEITSQIKEFFSLKGTDSIDQLNGIGFVVQASLPCLTHTQRYIFDSILSIFGKDISESIFMMVTFADRRKPPVLTAIKEAKLEYQKSFKFNNSALYVDKDDGDDDDDDQFNEMHWKMGQKSFENFFQSFAQARSVSLKLTRQVLDEREQLECVLQGLGPQIKVGLHKVDQLRQEEMILTLHEKDIMINKDFKYKVDVIKHRKIKLPTGEHVTNCIQCNMTCHHPCMIPRDEDKKGCAAMKDDTCTVCPGNCHWSKHVNNEYRFEFYNVTETRTSEGLKKRYQEATSKKMEKEKMMQGLTQELETMYHGLFAMISRAKDILARLDEIALKPNPLSEVDYIDLLIQSEEMEAKEGWTRRVEAYRQVREEAEMLSKIKDKEVIQEKTKGSVAKLWQFVQKTFLSIN